MKNLNSHPLISVVMPVYNAEKYVKNAIESILNQTYKKFEFIIIDDYSNDLTLKVLKNFEKLDKRIVLIRNKKNLGVTRCLNEGIAIASGKYIIRMDADDWSYPERFDLQVELMETNPDVLVSGSYVEICDSKLKTKYIREYHINDTDIRKHIFRYSPFAHPTTIWVGKILKSQPYDERLETCQDYELYFRIGKLGKFMNLDKTLFKLRMHNRAVSTTKSDLQSRTTVLIRFYAVLMLGYNMSTFDKLYNLLQEIIVVSLFPVRVRFFIFNILRRFNFY